MTPLGKRPKPSAKTSRCLGAGLLQLAVAAPAGGCISRPQTLQLQQSVQAASIQIQFIIERLFPSIKPHPPNSSTCLRQSRPPPLSTTTALNDERNLHDHSKKHAWYSRRPSRQQPRILPSPTSKYQPHNRTHTHTQNHGGFQRTQALQQRQAGSPR